ncbi:MAG TPA: hypothetical protein VG937_03235 [Polyangiaceae bacterium]|nr:hypothetical protein [Polyangiaceae bacterium]
MSALPDLRRRATTYAAALFGSHRGRLVLAAWALLLSAFFVLLAPMLADFSTYGFHDWDAHSAYRYITTLSLKQYGEGPWWHPWLCGGVPAWGYVEGATNLVSPYLPIYLLFDIRTALRLEVVGNGLLGLWGAYLLARRFSQSPALCAAFAGLFVLNGRWALQAAVGHTWHLQYALTPWLFLCFEEGRRRAAGSAEKGWFKGFSVRPAVYAGVGFAYLVYAGGIYPLPQTALLLGLYALLVAGFERRSWPIAHMAVSGVVALGLSAPKLFALADYMRGAPRLIDSPEKIGLAELVVMLTDPTQRYGSRPVRVPAYNWHEWGLYVGGAGLFCLGFALVFARGTRGQSLKLCGLLCLLLGFGAFHEYSPWALLHQVPPFSSQHVPSRFHYLMLFFLGLAFVDTVGPWLDRKLEPRRWLGFVLLLPLALFLRDLVAVNQVPFQQAFWMRAPDRIVPAQSFEHRLSPPLSYQQPDWAAPMLLAMFDNVGVVHCYGADPELTPAVRAADAPGYRGLAYVADGPGTAEVVEWTPNRAVVRVQGARPSALVVYNMNYDPSWSVNGEPALNEHGLVAARLVGSENTLRFSYFPRTFAISLPLFAVTLLALFRGRRAAAALTAFIRSRAARRTGTNASPP